MADSFARREAHLLHHHIYNNEQGRHEADGLQRVGEHQRAHAAPASVEPDGQHQQSDGHGKGHTKGVHDKLLDDDAGHVELHRRANHLRQQEEGCSRKIAAPAQPAA